MIDISAIKSLGRETKALVLIVEYQARRMPMFQMRELLELLSNNDEDKRQIAELVEQNLIGRGYPRDQVSAFLADLKVSVQAKAVPDDSLENTRRIRQAFTQRFERPQTQIVDPSMVPPPGQKPLAGMVTDGTSFIPRKSSPALPGVPPAPPLAGVVNDGTSIIPRRPSSPNLPSVPSAAPGTLRPSSPALPSIPTPPSGTVQRRPSSAVMPAVPPPAAQGSASISGPRKATFVFDTGAPPVPPPAGVAPPAAKPPSGHFAALGAAPLSPVPHAPLSGDLRPLIVLAEDDKRARMVFRLRLEEAGFAVLECGTGTEAWERILGGGIVAAVLDMKMPGMHGLEVLKNMVNNHISIPVVVCTAYDQLEDEFVVQTYPKLRYLVKPIAPETMVTALRELLAGKTA